MVKFSHWRDGRGLACMIDVEFATLGIIRCNGGDSVRLHLNVLKEIGRQRDSSWCFMVSCFSFLGAGYRAVAIKTKISCGFVCNVALRPSSACLSGSLFGRRHAFNAIPQTHKDSLADFFTFQLRFD